jgi:hypothetical protein
MTTPADDAAVEDAFEAYLAGRPVPEKAADLAVFAEAVRETATAPGRPNAALAELLATGLLTDQSSPSVRTARSAGAPPSRGTSRTRNRRRFAMIFPVILAKILSAGAVAQAATGAGIVVVVVTGAGAAGALPDPLQDTVATVVETVTPLELPSTDDDQAPDEEAPETPTDPADPAVPVDDTDEGDEADEPDEAELTLEEWEAGPDPEQSFGSWVSSGARLGYVDGATVSKYAHLKKRGETVPATPTAPPTEPADDADTEIGDDSDETEAQSSTRGAGNGKKSSNGNGSGKGNGKGSGKGNGRN